MADDLVRAESPEVVERRAVYLDSVKHVPTAMIPQSLDDAWRLSDAYAKSNLVPPEFRGNAANCLVAIMAGASLGLNPFQAITGTAVINGRPSLYGDTMAAVVLSSPLCEWMKEPPVENGVAICIVKRRGWSDPVTRSFTMDDAKKARLWGKSGPWTDYPDRMLRMRARAFAFRDAFPDVLRGMAITEELQDTTPVAVAAVEAARPDPVQAMRNDLACSEEQWAQIVGLWDDLKIPQAQRIVEAKKYAGHAVILAQKLIDLAEPLPPAPTIPSPVPAVTKHTRKRFAKAKAEGKPAADVAPPLDPPTNEAVCEHGIDIMDPCDACIAKADELAREAPPEPPDPEKPKTDDDLPF